MTAETVSLQIRMPADERDAIRRTAEAEGLSLRALLARWVSLHSSAPAAMTSRNDVAMTSPDFAHRVEALEARVDALEGRRARPAPAKPAARPATAEGLPPLTATGRQYRPGSKRAPVSRADLPAGFPATGAELTGWREWSGLPRTRFAAAVGQSGESLRLQEGKGDAPLSSALALKLVAAVEAGDLPAPG
jgi:DNA-binding transcriptional regulator YiaG